MLDVKFIFDVTAKKKYQADNKFWQFWKNLFYSSLAHILQPLHLRMTMPEVTLCPDGHFCWVIYSLGLYVVNYSKQALVARIVQEWCLICLVHQKKLDKGEKSDLQTKVHTQSVIKMMDRQSLWDNYSIDKDVIVSSFFIFTFFSEWNNLCFCCLAIYCPLSKSQHLQTCFQRHSLPAYQRDVQRSFGDMNSSLHQREAPNK